MDLGRTPIITALLVGCAAPSGSSPPVPTTPTTPIVGSSSPPDPAIAGRSKVAFEAFALPGLTGPASLDYLAFEARRARVWVPVATSGSVDVFDIGTRTFDRVEGFRTAEREVKGRTRTMGPSAVALGDAAA
jgi:hypothetical protein